MTSGDECVSDVTVEWSAAGSRESQRLLSEWHSAAALNTPHCRHCRQTAVRWVTLSCHCLHVSLPRLSVDYSRVLLLFACLIADTVNQASDCQQTTVGTLYMSKERKESAELT